MEIDCYIIDGTASIRAALKKLDDGGEGFLAVYWENEMYGIITDGDIRRAILNEVDLDREVRLIANREFDYITNYDNNLIEKKFRTTKIRHLPIVVNNCLVDVIFEETFLLKSGPREVEAKKLENPLVIMAGGKGTRLYPYTKVLPKALIPINGVPIVEVIMGRFKKHGIHLYHVCLNHKAGMVRAYFDDQQIANLNLVEEKVALGTAGALALLGASLKTDFFLSNCDVLVDTNYHELLDFHRNSCYAITIVGALTSHQVPYGVCRIINGGDLKEIQEKPEYDLIVNTGLYVLSPEVLTFIPANRTFDMTDLISRVQISGAKVGVYPVSEKAWIDIGQLDQYNNLLS